MTSEFNPRSFGRSRERAAPDQLNGHWSGGVATTIALDEITLVVAIKSHCDGCRAFIESDLEDIRVPVVFISSDEEQAGEWRDARQPVFVSPEAFQLLDVRWPPLYVLIDPCARRVICEGVLFGPAQVATEIARYLDA